MSPFLAIQWRGIEYCVEALHGGGGRRQDPYGTLSRNDQQTIQCALNDILERYRFHFITDDDSIVLSTRDAYCSGREAFDSCEAS